MRLETAAVALAIGAAVRSLWTMTSRGAAWFADGDIYIATARRLRAGLGFTIPSPLGAPAPELRFPPGFPFALHLALASGAGALEAARGLNAALLAANLALAAWLARRWSARAPGAALAVVVLASAAVDALFVHATILSEPLFIFLTLLALAFLSSDAERPKAWKAAAAALAVGLSVLVRFAGVAWIPAGALLVARKRRGGVRDATAFALGAGAPIGLWLLHNRGAAGRFTSREWFYTSPWTSANARFAKETLLTWATQDGASPWARALPPFLAAALLAAAPSAAEEEAPLVFALAYAAFMAAMLCVTEPAMLTESSRYFAPLHLILLAVLAARAARLSRRRGAAARACVWTLAAVLAASQLRQAARWRDRFPDAALGYAAARWKNSALVAWAKEAPSDAVVYTNAAAPLLVYAQRGAALLPQKTRLDTGASNPGYDGELRELAAALRERRAVLLLFDESEDSYDMPSRRELEDLLPLKTLARTPDGAVLAAAAP